MRIDYASGGPRSPVIVTVAHHHVRPPRVGGVAKRDHARLVVLGPSHATNRALAARLKQCLVKIVAAKRFAAVAGNRHAAMILTTRCATMKPGIQHHVSVFQFHRHRFVVSGRRRFADVPRLAVVIAVYDETMIGASFIGRVGSVGCGYD